MPQIALKWLAVPKPLLKLCTKMRSIEGDD
jgi:hypothetical protein